MHTLPNPSRAAAQSRVGSPSQSAAASLRRYARRRIAVLTAVACATAVGTTIAGGPSPAMASTPSLVFGAVADSYVSAAHPNANYGASSILIAGSANRDRRLSYLKFTVAGVPTGATGISARLQLSRTAHHLPPQVSAATVPITAWSESTLTMRNAPPVGTSLGTAYPTSATGSIAFAAKVSGNGTYAFAVTAATTTDTARFDAKDGATPRPTLTVSYTPPPLKSMWVGAAVNVPNASISSFDAANSSIGPLQMRRSFNSTLPTSFATSSAKDDATQGHGSFVSWKPPGGDFVGAAAGKYDTAVTAWAKTVPATGVYATAYHEPENDMTGPQFVAMQRHLYTVVKRANPTIHWGPVYMSYWWQPTRLAGKGGAQAWWVGSGYADFTAVDTYSATVLALNVDPEFMSWYNFMLDKSVPMLIAEYGQYVVKPGTVANPTMQAKRAQVIATDAAWIKSQGRIKMWLYWDGTGAQGNWSLTDAASQKAWRNIAVTGRVS